MVFGQFHGQGQDGLNPKSTKPRIETRIYRRHIRLSAGLNPKSTKPRIETWGELSHTPQKTKVSTLNPLNQGLKLVIIFPVFPTVTYSLNPKSTKPRIETGTRIQPFVCQ